MKNSELNTYKHESQISANIEDVKNALKDILKLNPTRFLHNEKDLNDMLMTYSFGEVKCAYIVTLQKIDDNTTKIIIDCSERYGGLDISVASLQSYVIEFLNILSARLNGADDTTMLTVMKNNNSDSILTSCSVYIIIIAIIATILILLF